MALAAAGLVPVGSQPTGPLSGKIVYTSPGHGWEWVNSVGWRTGRGDSLEIEEAFGNQDQMTLYADYLFRAGATIVPMRPVGRQLNEVVLDNDSAGVSFTGAWSDNSGGPRWYDEDYGAATDSVKYRFATTSPGTETAVARYTPNIPQAGFYPVYTWVAHSGNRTSQLYTVNHTGGQTEVRVDHSMVGHGWVYLGAYHFDAGSSAAAGSVQISNEGAAGKVVIADAIRFGNGMGDVRDSNSGIGTGSVSGYPREDENSLMWLWRAVGEGLDKPGNPWDPSDVIGTGNVSAPARMAEHMNANTNDFGDSVYIGIHSNAAGGRGAVGLISNNPAEGYVPTPNQAQLALYTGRQINQDMQALNGVFEHNWGPRTTHTYSSEFGEINDNDFYNSSGVVEMDATIIEVGFHDQTQDAQLLRDPRARDQLARSTYEATLEYFDHFGGLSSPPTTPSAPLNVRAESHASGAVTVSWNAGPTGVYGQAATGYRIYASSDGYGFDGGTFVAGGGTNTATLTGYDASLPYYFKVVAVNAGGESKASEALAVVPNGGARRVLIVNGFDRVDRFQNFRYPYAHTGDGLVDRVWPRYNNSFDYTVQAASAIHANAPEILVSSTSNEALVNGSIDLNNYDAVMWILGEESTETETFSAAEQSKVSAYLAQGGKLFVSGAEIGYDLDAQGGGASFFNNTLKADFVANDAASYNVTAAAGSIFAGLNFSFSSGSQFSSLTSQTYNVDAPDRISPLGGATAALNYSSGSGAAGIQYADAGSGSQLVMLAFPFETITTAANRAAVMERVIQYFQLTELPTEIEAVLDNDDGAGVYGETGSWVTSGLTGYNGTSYRYANTGSDSTAQWSFAAPFDGYADVFVQYRASGSRATSAVYQIDTGAGVETATVDQTAGSLTWVPLGEYFFEAGQRTVTLNAMLSSGGAVVNADAVRIVLTAGTAPDADFNSDGQVDGHDFLTWQRGLGGEEATPEQGDANGDAAVDGSDLSIWQWQFAGIPQGGAGASAALAAASAETKIAPEPSFDLAALAQRESLLRDAALSAPLKEHVAADSWFMEAAAPSGSPRGPQQLFATGALRDDSTIPIAKSVLANEADEADAIDLALSGQLAWSWRDSI